MIDEDRSIIARLATGLFPACRPTSFRLHFCPSQRQTEVQLDRRNFPFWRRRRRWWCGGGLLGFRTLYRVSMVAYRVWLSSSGSLPSSQGLQTCLSKVFFLISTRNQNWFYKIVPLLSWALFVEFPWRFTEFDWLSMARSVLKLVSSSNLLKQVFFLHVW